MAAHVQPSFAKGEIGPELWGRFDLAQYQTALRKAYNMIVQRYGGIVNRPGTIFVGPVKNHDTGAYLFPFEFDDTDTYMLEFGEGYMRPIRNDQHVLETAKNITGITQADPGVVTIVSHGLSNGDDLYVSGVGGMTELNGRYVRVAGATTNTFQLVDQATGANIDTSDFGAYTSGGTVARLYEIETPYALSDIPLIKFTQSADQMTLVHPSYYPRELVRADHDDWTLREPTFAPQQAKPEGVTVAPAVAASTTYRYRVTALAEVTLEESLSGLDDATITITALTKANPGVATAISHGLSNGDEVELDVPAGMTELDRRRFKVANVTANTFELEGEDTSSYETFTQGEAWRTFTRITNGAATPNNTISWDAVAGAARYSVYREENGIFGWIGDTEDTSFVDSNIDPDLTISPPAARNPFLGAGNYPGAVGYHEQRRVFGGSNNEPDTSYYSVTGSEDNFSVSTPTEASDAVTATLTGGKRGTIRHYVPGEDLIVLTSVQEWRVTAGEDAGFEANTIRQKPQTSWGAGHQRPIDVDGTILFVQENEINIRALGYDFAENKYLGKGDMTLFAPHLFETETIERWAFSRSPEPCAFVVRSDGWVCCLTFDEAQEVAGWTRWHTTNGSFEDVAVIRPSQSFVDEFPYFVVKRKINGSTVRYIERLHDRRYGDEVKDCFFVDCGLSLDNPVAITGISAADPVVVTAPSHGFSNGDEVDISGVVWEWQYGQFCALSQPDQLNGRRFTVANATTDTFELEGEDGSAFEPYLSGGEVRKAVTSIGGLHHLAGESVVILADGNVVSGQSVSATGGITLTNAASRVHIGLKMTAEIETLDFGDARIDVQGRKKTVPSVVVRFHNSRGLFVGTSTSDLVEIKQREFENMGDPIALFTGDKEVTLNRGWGRNIYLTMRQRYPLPMDLLFIRFEYDRED